MCLSPLSPSFLKKTFIAENIFIRKVPEPVPIFHREGFRFFYHSSFLLLLIFSSTFLLQKFSNASVSIVCSAIVH